MSDFPIYVIGSGPASISCAQALVDDGYPVVILDAGIELEAEQQLAVDALLASAQWDEATQAPFVDASVLPSIPSTTITLTVMANAYRIGKEWHHGV